MDKMATCQISFLKDKVPLWMWYNFCWRTDKMSVDETDTIRLIDSTIADIIATEANFTAGSDKQE